MVFYLVYTWSICFIAVLISKTDVNRRALAGDANLRLQDSRTKGKYVVQASDASLILIFIVLAVVVGLHGLITYDSFNYKSYFDIINSGSTIVHPAKSSFLFDWVCRIIFLVGGSVHAVFLFYSTITFIFLYKAIKYIDINRFLFIILFMLSFQYFDLFNIVRQGATDAIGLYVILRLLDKQKKHEKESIWIIPLMIAALLTHKSFVVVIAVWLALFFFKEIKIPFIAEIAILVFSVAIAAFLANNTGFSNMLSTLFGATWRVGKYNQELILGTREILEGILGVFVWVFLKFKAETTFERNIGFLTWLFVLTRFMTTNFFILYRITYVFEPFYFIGIIKVGQKIENRTIKYAYIALVAVFYLLFFYYKIKGYESFHGFYMISLTELFR